MKSKKSREKQESGAHVIVAALKRHGITKVFMYPGGTIAPILHAIETKSDIKIICARSEQGAGYAALAYARLTGTPAVMMVTSGPGVTNAVTPIADAYFDNVPLVLFTGQVGTSELRGKIPVRQRGFQECDTVDIFTPVSKSARLITDVRVLPDALEKAFFDAQHGRKGPVVLDLPMDVQRAVVSTKHFLPIQARTVAPARPPAGKIKQLAQLIQRAERPILLAGGGVIASGAEDELRKLAERHCIPVVMSLPGIGAYPSEKPLSLGLIGYVGSEYANRALHAADLVICVGTTLHVRQTGSLPTKMAPWATIVRIDIDREELVHSRVPTHLYIHADARAALRQLLAVRTRVTKGATDAWRAQIDECRAQYPLTVGGGTKLKPQQVIAMVDEATRSMKPVIVTTGVGQHQMWVPRHFQFDVPQRQLLTSSGHGTMGFDLPAAIGAKIARPDATVICFVGDGSLQMNIQELATVVDLNLDINIIVLDNHSLNIVAQFQRQNWKSHPTTGDKYNPNFADIAQAYGIWSVEIKSQRGAKAALSRALRRKGPVLIHCTVDQKEDLLPMLLGGHELDDMSSLSSF